MSLIPSRQSSTDKSKSRWGAVGVATLATVSLLALAGCSTSGAQGKTEISFTSWDTETVMAPLITAFEAANPDITVKASYVVPSDYISTLQTRLLAGTASDVFIINPEDEVELAKNNYMVDLTKESFAKVLSPANAKTYSVDNHLYGVSVSSWGGGILYNADLLKKVGFTEPPQSWADFLALSKKLQDAGITPFYEPGDGISVSLLALLGLQNDASGGTMDADIFSGKSSFEKEWTPALTAWGDLFKSGLETRDVAGLNGDQVLNSFMNGEVAMIGTGTWTVATVHATAPDMNIGFFAVPGTTSGKTFWAGAGSPAYAVNAKSDHQEQALKFLDFIASKDGAEAYNKATQQITTTSNFTPVVDPAIEPMVKDVQAGHIYFASVAWPAYQNGLSPYVNSVLQEFIQGQHTPDEVGKLIDEKLAALKANG
jgi:raffinose/stachyose/melibiose transport system substrate-binding protein